MKHLTLLLTTALAGAALITGIPAAHAVPALPRPIVFTQSDGTQLTIRIIGDEHRHYALSQEGFRSQAVPAETSTSRPFHPRERSYPPRSGRVR